MSPRLFWTMCHPINLYKILLEERTSAFPLLELVVEQARADAADAAEDHEREHGAHPDVGHEPVVLVVLVLLRGRLIEQNRDVVRRRQHLCDD